MAAPEKVTGPASYFLSIEKTYGQPIEHGLGVLKGAGALKHMELVSLLKTEPGDRGLSRAHDFLSCCDCPADDWPKRNNKQPRESRSLCPPPPCPTTLPSFSAPPARSARRFWPSSCAATTSAELSWCPVGRWVLRSPHTPRRKSRSAWSPR